MTREEIIQKFEETMTFDKRSVQRIGTSSELSCVYHGGNSSNPDSPGCAIGLLLPEELAIQADQDNCGDVDSLIHWFQDPDLKENFPKITEWLHYDNLDFLQELQNLHDGKQNWDEKTNGLSLIGKNNLELLKENYVEELQR